MPPITVLILIVCLCLHARIGKVSKHSLHKVTINIYICIYMYIYIYILTIVYIYINYICGSVAKKSDTQAVGYGFDPRPDH